jgi:hypothetical protein
VNEQLDYKFNPRRGFDFLIGGSAGTKTIFENNTIISLQDPLEPDYDFASLYDSIDLKTLIIQYQYKGRVFLPLFKKSTLLLQATGAAIINEHLLQNELLRIGGNSIMRGFDEQSVTASSYHILTTEYRFLFLPNSFAAIFVDGGWVEDGSDEPGVYDFLAGFGAGVSLETKAGIFGLNYALGGIGFNNILVKNAKIHFGYINYF